MDVAKISKPTFNHKVKGKVLLRTDNGTPVSKLRQKNIFCPNNPKEAKNAIKNDNFILFKNEYDLKRKADFKDHLDRKQKFVGANFRPGYYSDNGAF